MQLPQWFRPARTRSGSPPQARKAVRREGYVEKGNKDEVFRYHIAKVDDEDDGSTRTPMLTNEDLVLGIRPEFLDIADSSNLECEIYGAMPTGMESTIKVRVGELPAHRRDLRQHPVHHRQQTPAGYHRQQRDAL